MRRTKEETEMTRRSLLTSALDMFCELGYEKTRLEDIAQAAGFTRGAIYHNFAGKAQILDALMDEFGIPASQIVKSIYRKDATPCENIRNFVAQSLTHLEDNEQHRKIQMLTMFNNLRFHEETKNVCEKIATDVNEYLAYLSGLLQAGIDQGEIRGDIDVHTTAVAILGMVNGVSTLWLIDQKGFSIKAYASNICECVLNGLRQ